MPRQYDTRRQDEADIFPWVRCVCLCVYLCVCVCFCVFTHHSFGCFPLLAAHWGVPPHTRPCTHTQLHTYTHTHSHTHMHRYIHRYTTYSNTHTHTSTLVRRRCMMHTSLSCVCVFCVSIVCPSTSQFGSYLCENILFRLSEQCDELRVITEVC